MSDVFSYSSVYVLFCGLGISNSTVNAVFSLLKLPFTTLGTFVYWSKESFE
ncbi:hypothetical protein NWE60_03225 [Mycoplasmopsis felis]|uniref:hypothetical protein n=1 Tax=Mycoplasmopsis felis TaxID=33923 RepID=UPI0021AF3EC3|nr:hypothetical protein [Mycoplasmopsis felis]UWV79293.1 hypothetical protein NW072_04500 [Mycoplasmopsis felis]WAM01580.1 hypothetical protein NWE60_03225 [Mycoplasmopsis felis]